jgi:predicted Zn-dependent protease
MDEFQEQFDDAMFEFSTREYDTAIEKLLLVLERQPDHFDARLALGMSYYRKGDYEEAIREGHKAEKLKPKEQLVHTNLSLYYMKHGDKQTAEHHGLQARIASWSDPNAPAPQKDDSDLKMAQPKLENIKLPEKFPDMPWKKNKPVDGNPSTS